ncbi:MAG: DivIVA domain-containing protein [Synergistaceae bacterium]|nr:DivIVA domain-containing protein [Synergistaceae bacterium]
MSELLTAKDVEVKVFRKVRFGGYSVPEVEDFLNQVADDLEAYVTQIDEKDARIQELEAFVKKQESMTDAIKDALIQARKAAKDMEEQAKSQTDKIIADAQEQAKKHITDAESVVQSRIDDAEMKASEIIARARISADEISQAAQERKTKAEISLSGIESEVETKRREAEIRAEEILSSARSEAKKLLDDAGREAEEYSGQMRYLNVQKQKFLNDAYSLLIEFGKVIDRAQEDMENEVREVRKIHEEPRSYNSQDSQEFSAASDPEPVQITDTDTESETETEAPQPDNDTAEESELQS